MDVVERALNISHLFDYNIRQVLIILERANGSALRAMHIMNIFAEYEPKMWNPPSPFDKQVDLPLEWDDFAFYF